MDRFVAFEVSSRGAELQGEVIAVWVKRRLADVFDVDDTGADLDEVHRGVPALMSRRPRFAETNDPGPWQERSVLSFRRRPAACSSGSLSDARDRSIHFLNPIE